MARPQLATDEQLLATAREAFLEHGPGVSTTTIAERAGVSQATLFKRFGTKEELMVAALLPMGKPAWLTDLEDGPDDRPLAVQLTEQAERVASFLGVLVPCMSVLRAAGIDHQQLFRSFDAPPPLMARAAITAWFRRAQARGLMDAAVDPQAASTAFLGSLQHRVFLEHLMGEATAPAATPESIAALVDVLVRGLRPTEAL